MKKTEDFEIKLDKLLQTVLAFFGDSQQAFQKKGRLLEPGSAQHNLVTEALKNPELTIERLLKLYLLQMRAETEKRADKDDGKTPVTWQMFEGIAHIECKGRDLTKFDALVKDSDSINSLVNHYKRATRAYLKWYSKTNEGKEYNAMIKEKLDLDKLEEMLDIYD